MANAIIGNGKFRIWLSGLLLDRGVLAAAVTHAVIPELVSPVSTPDKPWTPEWIVTAFLHDANSALQEFLRTGFGGHPILRLRLTGDSLRIATLVAGKDKLPDSMELPATHALITNWPHLLVGHGVADCGNLTFWDPKTGFMSVVHVRRDLFPGIVDNTFLAMEEYGSKMEDVLVAGGPMICRYCYNSTADEIDLFSDPAWKGFAYAYSERGTLQLPPLKDKTKPLEVDMRGAIHAYLTSGGMRSDNIQLTNTCTSCARNDCGNHAWPSARRNRTRRFLAVSAILHER
jgi:copper oxidase (laccase) domain-containing protein